MRLRVSRNDPYCFRANGVDRSHESHTGFCTHTHLNGGGSLFYSDDKGYSATIGDHRVTPSKSRNLVLSLLSFFLLQRLSPPPFFSGEFESPESYYGARFIEFQSTCNDAVAVVTGAIVYREIGPAFPRLRAGLQCRRWDRDFRKMHFGTFWYACRVHTRAHGRDNLDNNFASSDSDKLDNLHVCDSTV